MDKENKRKYHPGSYLKDYLDETNITEEELAKKLGISVNQVSLIINAKEPLTYELANKLSILFGTSVDFWLNLQSRYDN